MQDLYSTDLTQVICPRSYRSGSNISALKCLDCGVGIDYLDHDLIGGEELDDLDQYLLGAQN